MCKNQAILLFITDGKKWHYLVVKDLIVLFKGITSKSNGDFCLNCLHSFRTEKNLKNVKMYLNIMINVMQKFLKNIKMY